MCDRTSRRQVLAGVGGAGVGLLIGSLPVNGEEGTERASASVPPVVDHDDLESFIDEHVEAALEDGAVGATVAIIDDGEVALTKGYGTADRETGRSVVAEETRFRIASVSKPVTMTAVMALIEHGDVDPHEDVREYLESVAIPGEEPITLAQLATHTAGFEERLRGTFVDDPDEIRPLATVLEAEYPARVYEPGEIFSYSNYGTALAGQVVADVTGQPFPDAVAELVFEPLGMDDSSFAPQPSAPDLATGYVQDGLGEQVSAHEHLELGPAGAMTTTATDMARFMRMHLGGSSGDRQPLEPDTLESMHEQWFTHHEALSGTAFGFLEESAGDARRLFHDGATTAFRSQLVLVPDRELGLFVAFNSTDGGQAARTLREAFLERYDPVSESEPNAGAHAQADTTSEAGRPHRADELEGTYRSTRVAQTTYEKLPTAFQAPTIEVSVADDGTLITESSAGTERWVELEALAFQAVDGTDRIAFGSPRSDDESDFLFDGFHALEALEWHETHAVQGAVAAVTALGVASAVVGWPLAMAWREYQAADSRTEWRPTEYDRVVAGGAGACLIAFVVGLVGLYLLDPLGFLTDPPALLPALFVLPIVGAAGAVIGVGYALRGWYRGTGSPLSRLYYTIVVLSALGFCWVLGTWNLLGFQF